MNANDVRSTSSRPPSEAIDYVVRGLTGMLVVVGAVLALFTTSLLEGSGGSGEIAIGIGLLVFAVWATLVTTFASGARFSRGGR
jgi:hypothetical protein